MADFRVASLDVEPLPGIGISAGLVLQTMVRVKLLQVFPRSMPGVRNELTLYFESGDAQVMKYYSAAQVGRVVQVLLPDEVPAPPPPPRPVTAAEEW